MRVEIIEKDAVIIGSGLASLYTTMHLDQKMDIAIVTKGKVTENNSSLAQGGIAASTQSEDHWQTHLNDTLIAGSFYNDVEATEMLVKNAHREIETLIKLGVKFDLDPNGNLQSTLEGGHSKRRVLHAGGDATGNVLMTQLIKRVKDRKNVKIFEETMAVEILTSPDGAEGIVAIEGEKIIVVKAPNVIIASGGIGGLFNHTTNHTISTGDGIALAGIAGCDLRDMSFIQFHPTAYKPEGDDSQCFLISEAVRGEGGILRGYNHHAFMPDIDERGDLAPRDVVARGIFNEMKMHTLDHIWLDITHKDRQYLSHRFPNIYQFLDKRGISMERDLIPVTPVEHYFVGGIKVDLNGMTNVTGIYACGEAASTGVHGANRLASNSLLECLVFGRSVAEHINQNQIRMVNKNFNYSIIEKYQSLPKANGTEYLERLRSVKDKIRQQLTSYVGIIRTDDDLRRTINQFEDLAQETCQSECFDKVYFEVKHMLYNAKGIIEDAIQKDSLGCHYKVPLEAVSSVGMRH